MSSKDIQNTDFILKGDLGTVNGNPITKVEMRFGSTVLTISPRIPFDEPIETEDADCEIVLNAQKLLP